MRRWRTTTHENRVQRAGPRRRVSLWYKQRWMAVAWRSGIRVWASIPSIRLTRVGKGTTFCRTQKLGRTYSSVCTRPTAQQSPPLRRHYANSSGTWLRNGCASSHRGGLLVGCFEKRESPEADTHVWHYHGLLRSSFVPPQPIRELRELTRYRRKLVESRSAERNRLLKLLETANIKLASVATDVFGVSGRLMLQALVQATATSQQMADLAKGLLRKKIPELELAL